MEFPPLALADSVPLATTYTMSSKLASSSPTTTKQVPLPSTFYKRGTKQSRLNKFLTNIYTGITECDPSISCWSNGGQSFTIKDKDAFEQEVLSKYFKNHSKWDTFIRQLNFYGFQKSRSDPDLQLNSKVVRYSHEFFKQGKPELLYQIQRTTVARTPVSKVARVALTVGPLQEEVGVLKTRIVNLEKTLDEKLQAVALQFNARYSARVHNLENHLSVLSPNNSRADTREKI